MKANFFMLAVVIGVVLMFESCATAIPVVAEYPAKIDMAGIEKLTVIPFEDAYTEKKRGMLHTMFYAMFRNKKEKLQDEERKTALTITRNFVAILKEIDSQKDLVGWTFVDPRKFAKATKEEYPSLVDAYITGTIEKFAVDDYVMPINAVAGYNFSANITRTVDLEWTYKVVRASDETVIAELKKSGREKQTFNQDNEGEHSPSSLAGAIIKREYKAILHELAPWVSKDKLKLAVDTANDPRMKEADDLVRGKNYADALNLYHAVYAETGNFAAGYNEALVTEARGDVPGAFALAQALDETAALTEKEKTLTRAQIARLKDRMLPQS